MTTQLQAQIDASRIEESVQHALSAALALDLSDADHRGGCFCLANQSGEPLARVLMGVIPAPKVPKYQQFAVEKALRLGKHPDHISSWQSREPDQERWGGAIRVGHHILSFSGLSELLDEAVGLVAARAYLGWTTTWAISQTAAVADASNNELFWKLLTNLDQRTRLMLIERGHAVPAS